MSGIASHSRRGVRTRQLVDSFVGLMLPYAGAQSDRPMPLTNTFTGFAYPSEPPIGWLYCYGQNVSRAKYPKLFRALCGPDVVINSYSGPTPFVWGTNAGPHGFSADDPVVFRVSAGGTTPTGLTAGTTYYVISTGLTSTNFELASSPGGAALAGVDAGSGLIFNKSPFGMGDGSSTFTLPDLRGRTIAGWDNMGGSAANRLTLAASGGVEGSTLGYGGGEDYHTNASTEEPIHAHTMAHTHSPASGGNIRTTTGGTTNVQTVAGANNGGDATTAAPSTANSGSSGSTNAHNNTQYTAILRWCIFHGELGEAARA